MKRFVFFFSCFIGLFGMSVSGETRHDTAFRYLESGRAFISEGRDTDGLKDLESVVTGFPQSPAAPLALETIYRYYLDRGSRKKAMETMDRLIEQYPSSLQAGHAMVTRGLTRMASLISDDINRAEADFRRAVRVFPDTDISDLAKVGLARIQLLYRNPEESERILVNVLIRRNAGPAFEAALETETLCLILQSRPVDAMCTLQRLRQHRNDTGDSDTLRDLILLKRLYLETESTLKIDPHFNAAGIRMKKPVDLLFENNQYLHVLDTSLSTILSLDPSTGSLLRRHAVPDTVHRLNRGLSGKPIRVGEKSLFSGAKRIGLGQAGLPERIIDACWSNPGRWWVLDKKRKGVLQFDINGIYKGIMKDVLLRGSERILPCPLGGTWLLCHDDKRIVFFDIGGKQADILKFQKAGYSMVERPVDISSDRFGHLYVLDGALRKVFVFNAGMQKVHVFSWSGSGVIRKPDALAVGNDGSLYIADRKSKTVYHLK